MTDWLVVGPLVAGLLIALALLRDRTLAAAHWQGKYQRLLYNLWKVHKGKQVIKFSQDDDGYHIDFQPTDKE